MHAYCTLASMLYFQADNRSLSISTGSILAVLNDPSFEHSQPSWIRTTLRHTPSPARKGLPFASYALAAEQQSREANSVKSGDVNSEDVESGGMESGGVEEVDFGEGLVTEFIAGEEERRDMKVLHIV